MDLAHSQEGREVVLPRHKPGGREGEGRTLLPSADMWQARVGKHRHLLAGLGRLCL